MSADATAGQEGALETTQEQTTETSPAGALDENASQSEQNATPEPVAEPQFVAAGVAEERVRKVQAAKDREVANLQKQLTELQAQQAPSNPVSQPTQVGEASFDAAMKLIEENRGQEGLAMMHQVGINSAVQEMQRLQQEEAHKTQEQQFLNQYMDDFNKVTTELKFSQQEVEAARAAAVEAGGAGRPISPQEAAMIGRFGSAQNALNFAQQTVNQQGQNQAQQAPQQSANGPIVAGGPTGNTPTQPTNQQGLPLSNPGAYKNLF